MTTIKPVGAKIIVQPIIEELSKTEGGIYTVDMELEKAIIVEAGDMGDIYKEGDTVIYPKDSGVSLPHYKKKSCMWLDGRPFPVGNVWALCYDENDGK